MDNKRAIENLETLRYLMDIPEIDSGEIIVTIDKAIKALRAQADGDLISRQAALDAFGLSEKTRKYGGDHSGYDTLMKYEIQDVLEDLQPVNPQEPKTGWNNHQIACMLADLFGDACACNYNGIDEWLPELCDFKDTCCPNPVGVACWEQFLKYSQSRYTECGYEIRDKSALQEPKTGRWIEEIDDYGKIIGWHCDKCYEDSGFTTDCKWNFCPNCGYRMESEMEYETD